MIADALKPAVISRVELVGTTAAQVWLDEDQRSLAIGKMGQNIALASQLVGLNINLVQSEKSTQERQAELDEQVDEAVE
ncbi:MAG: transcription elongation factor NusA [Candidatus Dependentiae bacterium ADurb.Bin331]|nr:MAG: transcription elongation factor NusA [Candidatus Dependentiae bacterium ADurb.Bin331]